MKTTFNYVARNLKDDKIERGVLGADDRNDAIGNLRQRGLTPLEVNERGTVFDLASLLVRRPQERLTFFRSYAALASAGASTNDTFNLLISQIRNSVRHELKSKYSLWPSGKLRFLRVIEGLAREVMGGVKLHDAMARRPNDFSEVECAMCQIGDATGELSKVLEEVSVFLERDRKFNKQLWDALTYPIVIAFVAVAMVILMIVKIIPEFSGLFAGFGVELPPTMKVMLAVSAFFQNPFCIVGTLGALFGAAFLFARSLGTPKGALAFDRLRLKIPVVGELIRKIVVSRICRVLAMLADSGKGPQQSLEIAIPVSESPAYAAAMTEAKEAIRKGQVSNLHEAIGRTNMFDPLILGFAQVGVKTGNVGEMLGKVSEYYESDIASLTAMIPTFVQTLVTLIMGGVVGLIVYSVYVPLTELVNNIHQ